MNLNLKNILYIDLLNKTYELKAHKNLNEFLGGVGIGLKLLYDNLEKNPIILSCGPLSGLFPYASKLSLVYRNSDGKIEELYGGGSFASKMRISGIDSILLYNKPKTPLAVFVAGGKVDFIDSHSDLAHQKTAVSGKTGSIRFSKKTLIDNYFSFGKNISVKNFKAITISGEGEVKIPNVRSYIEIYNNILDKRAELSVEYSDNPSCWGCPAGCAYSKFGETNNIAVLPRCLVSCQFAESIYKDVPLVFSCLTVLGLGYNHDDIEKVPNLVGDLRRMLK